MVGSKHEIILGNPPFNPEAAREALDNGELLRLLTDLEAGRITPEQLQDVLEARDRDDWAIRFLRLLFGR